MAGPRRSPGFAGSTRRVKSPSWKFSVSGFGFSFDTLEIDAVQHPFGPSLKNLFRGSSTPDIMVARFVVAPHVVGIGSGRFRRFCVDLLSNFWRNLRELRDMVDVIESTATEILNSTKEAIQCGRDMSTRIGGGKDIMSLLVKANMAESAEDGISDEELMGQVGTLTFAAMDTSSNALASILHLLSLHSDVQEKLRQEVTEAYEAYGGDLDYDTLVALPLLDAVIRETLRLWPPVPTIGREAKKDTILPLETPIRTLDGKVISEVAIPAGTTVMASAIMYNRDPETWGPDADQWRPERWLKPLSKVASESRSPGVYSNLLTFAGGSRSCIGFKFAQLEIKVILSLLLTTFRFSPSGKKIMWQMNGITQPTTEEAEILASGERKLELPIKLSLV